MKLYSTSVKKNVYYQWIISYQIKKILKIREIFWICSKYDSFILDFVETQPAHPKIGEFCDNLVENYTDETKFLSNILSKAEVKIGNITHFYK